VTVDVVLAGLAVVLDNEDRRVLPVLAVRDRVDDLADRQVVVGDLGEDVTWLMVDGCPVASIVCASQ
jgi:hypothetical protein